jgi:hypothetical protein
MPGRAERSAAIAVAAAIALHSLRASGAEPVRSVEIVESSAFLEAYRTASESQAAEFYNLYSDRAVIHIRTQDQGQGVAFQGRAFKAWGRQLLNEGRAGLDGSIFRDATVEQRGSRLLIRAKRYSTTRCYWDLTYQVGIEREGVSYRIVDERLTTNPGSRCGREPIVSDAFRGTTSPAAINFLPSPGPGRPLDLRSTGDWRPLSQQELADKALNLAQQMASAQAALSNPAPQARIVAAAHPPVSFVGEPSGASTGPLDASTDLCITPAE